MKTIKLFIILCICGSGFHTLAQNKTEFKSERKYKSSYYDQENLKLLELNDTLNIFINEEKKVSFLWNNISYFNRSEGFEKEIDTLFIMFEQLNLDFENNAYDITYRPSTKELLINKNEKEKFTLIANQAIPINRHTVTFVYRGRYTGEIKFYLGEIDELKVWKDAGLTERIKSLYELNDWKKKYFTKVFSKDLLIKENGEQEVITYKNIEKTRYLSLHMNLGINVVADRFPAITEFSLMYNLGSSNKRMGMDFKVGAFYRAFNFVTKNDDNNFMIQSDGFLGAGFSYSPSKDVLSLRYGRLVRSHNSFFDTYKNNLGFEIALKGPFKINIDSISEKMFSGRTIIAFGITARFL